eukprot:5116471-Pleurochrysis_carterae.AAC.1
MKTAHRDFPKDELLAAVGEIKGKSAEARAARQRRRGTQMAFTREYRVGSRSVIILAAGHSKKVPLLLVAIPLAACVRARCIKNGGIHTMQMAGLCITIYPSRSPKFTRGTVKR